MATTYISRTFTASATGKEQFTLSMWVKRSGISATQYLFNAYSDTNNYTGLYFDSTDKLVFSSITGGSDTGNLTTNRLFRDTSGYFHIVAVWDSNNGTAGDRMKLYINGVEETSFATDTNPSSGQDSFVGDSGKNCLLGYKGETGFYFNGIMSWVQLVDSAALAPTEFGSIDATTGEWVIKPTCYATAGTNGFCLKMEDSTNLDLDTSSNTHTFTTSGTLTATQDCPSDVFATINQLQVEGGGSPALTFSHGNTKVTRSGNWRGHMSTLGVNKGKYYWECKCTGNIALGIAQFGGEVDTWTHLAGGQSWLGDKQDCWILYNNGSTQVRYGNTVQGGTWNPVTGDGDIVMIAFDATNGTIWTGVNGTWHNSATSTEIANGTTTNAMYSGITIGTELFGAIGSTENGNLEYNFGNGYFASTVISSAGTNASNIGIFEYDVPTGFTALSTKGINS